MVLPNVDLENTWKIFQPFLFAFLGICSHYAVCKETFIVNLLKMFYLLFSQFLNTLFIWYVRSHGSHSARGTQRLLSVRRSKYCLEFSIAWERLKISVTVPFMYKNSWNFLKFNFSDFTLPIRLFFAKKRKPKIFGFEMVKETRIRKNVSSVLH